MPLTRSQFFSIHMFQCEHLFCMGSGWILHPHMFFMNYRETVCQFVILTMVSRRISTPRASSPPPPSFAPPLESPCWSPHVFSPFPFLWLRRKSVFIGSFFLKFFQVEQFLWSFAVLNSWSCPGSALGNCSLCFSLLATWSLPTLHKMHRPPVPGSVPPHVGCWKKEKAAAVSVLSFVMQQVRSGQAGKVYCWPWQDGSSHVSASGPGCS